jgi:flagellar hook-basal body complex protein FliE
MDPVMVDMVQLSAVKSRELERAQVTEPSSVGVVSFEDLLSSSMKQVNALQLESDEMVRKLATGDVEDISEVVLASSRAEIALKMFMELRNKFLDAYQQLSRMSA